MQIDRRRFVAGFALALGGLRYAFAGKANDRLPIGFSTLGCPNWEWSKILDFAQQNSFAAVELRGLQGTMDLTSRPEFALAHIDQSKKEVAGRGLRLSCLGASANLHDADAQKHEQQLVDARKFIDLASELGVPYVRVFGNKIEGPREEVIARVATSLHELGSYAGSKHVTVLLESHGDFIDSPTLRAVLEGANSQNVALLWDAHHTFVDGKEDPEFTVKQLGKYIRHTHLKDSKVVGNSRRYVLTGTGEVPVRRQVEVLAATGYKGYYSFEWEKAWHPDIDEPEIALADYAKVVTQYLTAMHSHS